jgi:NAD(P)-dependent dehydrogenase (short-subunit alcohol dehydrogenase family)
MKLMRIGDSGHEDPAVDIGGTLYGLTFATAADHIHAGIRANSVASGTAGTPWVRRLLDTAEDSSIERVALVARQPRGRLVSAGEVGNAIVYLASPHNGSSVGMTLHVDGGMDSLRQRPVGND